MDTEWVSIHGMNYLFYLDPKGRVPVGYYNSWSAMRTGRWEAMFLGHRKAPGETRYFSSMENAVRWLEAKFQCAHKKEGA